MEKKIYVEKSFMPAAAQRGYEKKNPLTNYRPDNKSCSYTFTYTYSYRSQYLFWLVVQRMISHGSRGNTKGQVSSGCVRARLAYKQYSHKGCFISI